MSFKLAIHCQCYPWSLARFRGISASSWQSTNANFNFFRVQLRSTCSACRPHLLLFRFPQSGTLLSGNTRWFDGCRHTTNLVWARKAAQFEVKKFSSTHIALLNGWLGTLFWRTLAQSTTHVHYRRATTKPQQYHNKIQTSGSRTSQWSHHSSGWSRV